jgi:hypothetical protein
VVRPAWPACFVSDTSGFDWGSAPDWIIAATAIFTLFYAGYQLRLLRNSRQDAVDAQNAATAQHREYLKVEQGFQLMAIDNQYEGVLQPSRKALLALRRGLKDDPAEGSIPEQISLHLIGLREGPWADDRAKKLALNEYFRLMQLPNYIETMGVLVAEGLVDAAMLIGLYDGMIERVIGDVLPHIYWRRERDNNRNYLIFAERLYMKAAAHMAAAAAR